MSSRGEHPIRGWTVVAEPGVTQTTGGGGQAAGGTHGAERPTVTLFFAQTGRGLTSTNRREKESAEASIAGDRGNLLWIPAVAGMTKGKREGQKRVVFLFHVKVVLTIVFSHDPLV